MSLTREENNLTFRQRLRIGKYTNRLKEIDLDGSVYTIWAYEDALKDDKDQSIEFAKYYICNKTIQYCERCGCQLEDDEIWRSNQSELKHYRHISHGRSELFEPALLILTRNSWRCHACSEPGEKRRYHTTKDDISLLLHNSGDRITIACKDFIATRALYMDQQKLADTFRIDRSTVTRLLNEKIEQLDRKRSWDNIETLGIYSIDITAQKKAYCLCTNPDEKTLIEWFPWSNHTAAQRFAEQLRSSKSNIKKVITSVDAVACEFAEKYFSDIERQIDRADVQERLVMAMENVRQAASVKNALKEILPSIKGTWPLIDKDRTLITEREKRRVDDVIKKDERLMHAYHLKEAGYEIYRQPDEQERFVCDWIEMDKYKFKLFEKLEMQMDEQRDGVISFAKQNYGVCREPYETYLKMSREPLDRYITLNIEAAAESAANEWKESRKRQKEAREEEREDGNAPTTLRIAIQKATRSAKGSAQERKALRGRLLYGLAYLCNARATEDKQYEKIKERIDVHKNFMTFENCSEVGSNYTFPEYITLHNFGIPLWKLIELLSTSALEDIPYNVAWGMSNYWNSAEKAKVVADIGSVEKIRWEEFASDESDTYIDWKLANCNDWNAVDDDQVSLYEYYGVRGLSDKNNVGAYTDSLRRMENPPEIDRRVHVQELVMYRPFCIKSYWLLDRNDKRLNAWERIFPEWEYENRVICISTSEKHGVNVLMTDKRVDCDFMEGVQCVPMYIYDEAEPIENEQLSFDRPQGRVDIMIRHSVISDDIWERFKHVYGDNVTKNDMFYYLYAILHSHKYNEMCKEKIHEMLLHVPMLKHFSEYVKIGRKLADLHLQCADSPENIDPSEMGIVMEEYKERNECYWGLGKMHFGKDKSVIEYNPRITIRNIPVRAYEYVLNGKSPVEWIVEEYACEPYQEPYDLDASLRCKGNVWNLLLSVISVSLKTLDLIEQLP